MFVVPIVIVIAYLAVLVNEWQVRHGGEEYPPPLKRRRRRKDEY